VVIGQSADENGDIVVTERPAATAIDPNPLRMPPEPIESVQEGSRTKRGDDRRSRHRQHCGAQAQGVRIAIRLRELHAPAAGENASAHDDEISSAQRAPDLSVRQVRTAAPKRLHARNVHDRRLPPYQAQ
jgi:hypothetical protein